jgi:PilZ domain-containing protein
MASVLDLDPVLLPAAAVRPIAVLGDQPLEPHAAGSTVKIGADLASLERRHSDAVRSARQQALEIGLAQVQRQGAEVVAERASTRNVVLKPGTIEFGPNSVPCMVRNFSEKGAALDVRSSFGLPDYFTVVLSLESRRFSARLAWRQDMRVGVVFESSV